MNFLLHLARALVGCPPPRKPRHERMETGDEIAARMPAFLGDENPLSSPAGYEDRQKGGLKLMDDDCHGFLLLTVHRDGESVRGRIELEANLQAHWMPAVSATLERIIAVERGLV